MSNRAYLVFCIGVFGLFVAVSALKKEEYFSGSIYSAECVETGKSEISVALTVVDGNKKGTFHFGLNDYLCRDSLVFFKSGSNVNIKFKSINGWFHNVEQISLDGKNLRLRGH
ncbi:hypothetical protein Q5V20_004550 [Vibrio parahaemolyticus]|uniref:Uncharacterized protein n=1 Tax=Vibrio marinisediminis TaxID=2758441 RepID=A0A7W2IVJ0_9VIBR|nr:hypothetical protein [Vibrio marinisediminis]ELA7892809.1 hypothetical protein [Vibrio parahaemolyticus]MBA5764691.1 hypothetical protein [Vibrio marinisediminis]